MKPKESVGSPDPNVKTEDGHTLLFIKTRRDD